MPWWRRVLWLDPATVFTWVALLVGALLVALHTTLPGTGRAKSFLPRLSGRRGRTRASEDLDVRRRPVATEPSQLSRDVMGNVPFNPAVKQDLNGLGACVRDASSSRRSNRHALSKHRTVGPDRVPAAGDRDRLRQDRRGVGSHGVLLGTHLDAVALRCGHGCSDSLPPDSTMDLCAAVALADDRVRSLVVVFRRANAGAHDALSGDLSQARRSQRALDRFAKGRRRLFSVAALLRSGKAPVWGRHIPRPGDARTLSRWDETLCVHDAGADGHHRRSAGDVGARTCVARPTSRRLVPIPRRS